jgi:hypothetical protein
MIEVSPFLSLHFTYKQETVASLLEQYKEETAWIGIVDKKKRGKVQKRILLISVSLNIEQNT